MRVLTIGSMYPPHHLGGYELMWRSSVRHLRARGIEVRVLATDLRLDRPDPDIHEDPDVHRDLRWYWRDHAFPRLSIRERRALERDNLSTLSRHLDEHQPDVVCWWAMGGMSLSLIESVRRRGIPALAVVVDDWLVYGPLVDAWQRPFGRLGTARLTEAATGVPTRLRLAEAARWLFVSEAVRKRAFKAGIHTARNAPVAHAGIDTAHFIRAPERGWGGRLLYVGRVDRRKGITTAIRALAELPEATLDVVGPGDEAHLGELETLVAELGLTARVRFRRAGRDAIAGEYAAADAVLFPVLWEEPFGLVPLEAMAVGRPVVATGAGGSGEYLSDGSNCLLFEPRDDPGALAAAVGRLAADPALRSRLREGGFATAAEHTEGAFNDAVARELELAGSGG